MAAGRPIPHWRQGGRRWAARAGKRQTRPQRGILYQAASRHPVANQTPLGFWMVDFCQEGRSQRSAPQKRHMAHWRRVHPLPPRKPSGWTREVVRCTPHLGRQRSPSTWSPELLGPGKGKKRRPNRVCPFVDYLRT